MIFAVVFYLPSLVDSALNQPIQPQIDSTLNQPIQP